MMDIYLVRHGEAAASWGESSDPGLSELGHEQARSAAAELAALVGQGSTLVSSPLARARETAAPLAAALNQSVAIDDAFREIPSPVPLEQRQPWLREFMQQSWQDQPESLLAWRDSALAQVHALPTPAVVFTHFLVINTIVGALQGEDKTLVFWPDNGSITRLRVSGATLEVAELGAQMQGFVN